MALLFLLPQLSLINTLAFLITTWLLTTLLYSLYNLYLHPLRRFPGPLLNASFHLPYVIQNIRGTLPSHVLSLHQKYGPVVRISPDQLAFTDPTAWTDIYGLQPGRVQNKKDQAAYTPPADELFDGATGIIHAEDGAHARLRRIYGQAFTPKAIEGLAGMLVKYANLLVEKLGKAVEREEVQDMSAWFNYTTFDLTGEFAFGEAFGCLEEGGRSHFFLETVLGGVVFGCQIWQLERYGLVSALEPFLGVFAKGEVEKGERMARYTRELVDARVGEGYKEGGTDVLNYLLQNKKVEDQLSAAELYENALTLVVAGSETTATLLSGVIYHLCRNLEVLEKVKKEVRTAFKQNDEITPTTVDHLEYMIAVLSEGSRIFPPTGFGFPRIISSTGGQSVAGHWIPEKTRCSVFHHAAYRYEGNFARAEEFIPERWLVNAPVEFRDDKRDVVQPFMVGPRGCIGKSLAYAEMRLLLAKMLYNFDFELAGPELWHERLRAYLIWERTPLLIRLKKVQR